MSEVHFLLVDLCTRFYVFEAFGPWSPGDMLSRVWWEVLLLYVYDYLFLCKAAFVLLTISVKFWRAQPINISCKRALNFCYELKFHPLYCFHVYLAFLNYIFQRSFKQLSQWKYSCLTWEVRQALKFVSDMIPSKVKVFLYYHICSTSNNIFYDVWSNVSTNFLVGMVPSEGVLANFQNDS